MGINRRVTGGKRIRHHKLFGSIETPPLGWTGDDFSFSLKDFNREVDKLEKAGKPLAMAQRDVGKEHGPQAWNWLETYYCATVHVPKNVIVQPPFGGDREYRFHDHNRLIAGWWYDRFLSKLGPTNTIGAWFATKIGFVSHGQPHIHRQYDLVPVAQLEQGEQAKTYRDTTYFMETPRCVGINPYTDYRYIGEFKRPLLDYPDYVQPVVDEIIKRFIKFHRLGVR